MAKFPDIYMFQFDSDPGSGSPTLIIEGSRGDLAEMVATISRLIATESADTLSFSVRGETCQLQVKPFIEGKSE